MDINPGNLAETGFWIVIISFLLYRFYQRFYNTRHQRKIRQADRVLKTIHAFSGQHASQQIFAYLRKIDPFVFEELILTCFQQAGCKIIRNKKYTGDGGIDGRVVIGKVLHLVQCKRYKRHINRQDVAEFERKIVQHGAKKGFFVHTGKTGKAAKEWRYQNIRMISGQRLLTLLQGEYPFARNEK